MTKIDLLGRWRKGLEGITYFTSPFSAEYLRLKFGIRYSFFLIPLGEDFYPYWYRKLFWKFGVNGVVIIPFLHILLDDCSEDILSYGFFIEHALLKSRSGREFFGAIREVLPDFTSLVKLTRPRFVMLFGEKFPFGKVKRGKDGELEASR